MSPNEQDKRFFEQLSKTETGKYLADYCNRIIDYVYDSRNWSEKDSKESAAQAVRAIKENLVERIRPSRKQEIAESEFE